MRLSISEDALATVATATRSQQNTDVVAAISRATRTPLDAERTASPAKTQASPDVNEWFIDYGHLKMKCALTATQQADIEEKCRFAFDPPKA